MPVKLLMALSLGLGMSALSAWAEAPAANPEPGAGDGGKSAVLLFGVYTEHYGFDKALSDYKLRIVSARSPVSDFPQVKDLFKAKVVILSDVDGAELSESQVKLLKMYVQKGGGLLVMGGPFAYGLGHMRENGLGEILPVELEPFDLKWEKDGKPLAKAADNEALKGFDFSANPMVYWLHLAKPKEGAEVLLKAGDYPALVAGNYGKGKVFAFMGTPMGVPGKGQVEFWRWDGWSGLVRNLVNNIEMK